MRPRYLRPALTMPQIYLYRAPIDFRKQAHGLAALVEQQRELVLARVVAIPARLACKARIGFDHELDPGRAKPVGERAPFGGWQDDAEMRDGDVMAIDGVMR